MVREGDSDRKTKLNKIKTNEGWNYTLITRKREIKLNYTAKIVVFQFVRTL